MKKETLGFKRALSYVLDLLCYSYYVKHDNLVSDKTFDELERLYITITKEKEAPNRASEREELYSNGVKFIYSLIKR